MCPGSSSSTQLPATRGWWHCPDRSCRRRLVTDHAVVLPRELPRAGAPRAPVQLGERFYIPRLPYTYHTIRDGWMCVFTPPCSTCLTAILVSWRDAVGNHNVYVVLFPAWEVVQESNYSRVDYSGCPSSGETILNGGPNS